MKINTFSIEEIKKRIKEGLIKRNFAIIEEVVVNKFDDMALDVIIPTPAGNIHFTTSNRLKACEPTAVFTIIAGSMRVIYSCLLEESTFPSVLTKDDNEELVERMHDIAKVLANIQFYEINVCCEISVIRHDSMKSLIEDSAESLFENEVMANNLLSILSVTGFDVSARSFGLDNNIPVWLSYPSSTGNEIITTLKRNWKIPDSCTFYLIQSKDPASRYCLVAIAVDNRVKVFHFLDVTDIAGWEGFSLRADNALHMSIVQSLLLPIMNASDSLALSKLALTALTTVSKCTHKAVINSFEKKVKSPTKSSIVFELVIPDVAQLSFKLTETVSDNLLEVKNAPLRISESSINEKYSEQFNTDKKTLTTDLENVVPFFHRENEIPDSFDNETLNQTSETVWKSFDSIFNI